MSRVAISGKRKTAIAKVVLKEGEGNIVVNKKKFDEYFRGHPHIKHEVIKPLILTDTRKKFDIVAHVSGGGLSGQGQALRHGISRALALISDDYKRILRQNGLLTRDARIVERKKPGQPKARKKFQYSKR